MPVKHHELSPSKFPAWVECPCFESSLEVRKDAVVVLAGSVQKAANLEEAKAIAKGGVD